MISRPNNSSGFGLQQTWFGRTLPQLEKFKKFVQMFIALSKWIKFVEGIEFVYEIITISLVDKYSKLEEAKRAYEVWLDLIEEREEENLLFEEERKRILMWKPPWYAGGKALF